MKSQQKALEDIENDAQTSLNPNIVSHSFMDHLQFAHNDPDISQTQQNMKANSYFEKFYRNYSSSLEKSLD